MLKVDWGCFLLCVLGISGSAYFYLSLNITSEIECRFMWRPWWYRFFFEPAAVIRKVAFLLLLYHRPIMFIDVLPYKAWTIAVHLINWIILSYCAAFLYALYAILHKKAIGYK